MLNKAGEFDSDGVLETDAYFVVDANVNYLVHPNVTLFCAGNNLLNNAYLVALRPAGFRPGMPRAFMFGLKAHF